MWTSWLVSLQGIPVGMDRLESRFLRFRGDVDKYALTGVVLLRSIIGYADLLLVSLESLLCGAVYVC